MMAPWKIKLLPIAEKEIEALPEDMQMKFVRIGSMLGDRGLAKIGMPYVRPLGEKLWEMRLSGRSGIARVIYVVMRGSTIWILRAFIKKTEKTPAAELAIALHRLKGIEHD